MSISTATENFKNWACSFSGCDGGDPYSEIWLCGIEWGYAKEKGQTKEQHQYDLAKYYREDLAKEISEGHYSPKDRYIIKNHLTYPFGIKVAKLYAAIKGHQKKI